MNIIKEANKVIQSISLSSEDEDDINISKEDNKVIQPVSLLNEEEEDLKSIKEDNKVIQPVSSLNENKEEDVNKIDLNTKDASSIKEEEDEENDVDIKNISWNDEEDDNIDIEEIERIIRSVHENQHIIDEEDDDEEEDIIVQEQVPVTPTKGTAAKSFETPQKSENISNELLDSPLKEYIVDEEEEISEVNLSSEGIVNDDVNDENSKDALKSDEEEEEEDDLNVDLSKTIKRGEFPKILFPKWDDSDEEDLYEEDDDFYFEGKEPVHPDKSYKDSLQSIETFVRQNTSFAINLFVKIADEILDESTERIVGLKK